MKSILLIGLILLSGCEPAFRLYVDNKSNSKVFIKSSPRLENLYDKRSKYYDTVLKMRIDSSNNYGTYELTDHNRILVFSSIGLAPNPENIPFMYLQVIKQVDTITLTSKSEIVRFFQRKGKTRDYFLVVDDSSISVNNSRKL